MMTVVSDQSIEKVCFIFFFNKSLYFNYAQVINLPNNVTEAEEDFDFDKVCIVFCEIMMF